MFSKTYSRKSGWLSSNQNNFAKSFAKPAAMQFESLEDRRLFSAIGVGPILLPSVKVPTAAQLNLAAATSAINAEYAKTASETDAYGTNVQSLLGGATSSVVASAVFSGAYVETFHYNGAIYYSPSAGAHVVLGGIGVEYSQSAGEFNAYGATIQSTLGLPTSDETAIAGYAGGRMNSFQYGVIDWSSATGAHAVIGGIYSEYASFGGAASWLGLPTTDETGSASNRSQNFQSGTIQWSSWTGTTVSAIPISITFPDGDELAVTAYGARDSVEVSQNGYSMTIIADGQTFHEWTPAAGIFVYTRGGTDRVTIDPGVTAQTTVECIDNAPTTVNALGSQVITWADSTDSVTGGRIHVVSSLAGGVSKAAGASLPDPSDIGSDGNVVQVHGSLFGTAPVMADINQGGAGDCFFLASLAADANQNPNAVRNMAVDMGDGTYVVEFFNAQRQPQFVRVNADLPANQVNYLTDARTGADGSIWGPIIEKAFAYFYTGANTYASISNGGHAWTAQDDLGAICDDFLSFSMSDNAFAQQVESDLQYGVGVTVATDATTTDLVSDHEYSIVGVTNVNGVNEYTLRNPWGTEQGASWPVFVTVNFATLTADTNWVVQASFV